MQIHTLVVVNLMLFVLYAVATVVNTRLTGVGKAARWFGAANLIWAGVMGLLLWSARSPRPALLPLIALLSALGLMMLHRSFAELLDRPRQLWRLQGWLVVGVTVCTLYLSLVSPRYPVEQSVLSTTLGIQLALTASALFSFAGEGVAAAGWFAGIALSLYSLVQLTRTVVSLHHGSVGSREAFNDIYLLWLTACLLANGATAFGFFSLSAAKLRLELLWRAQIDELTGLLNRWAFKRIAVRETMRCMRTGGRLAVIMMDLDGMKAVNDRLGHGCGDAVLQAVSATLLEAVRDRDSIARMGGDEFCLLLPDTDVHEAETVAERLRRQIEALNIRYRSETVKIRASFGVSSSDQNGWNWQELVDRSDAALYEAKRSADRKVVAAIADVPASAVSLHPAMPISERRRRAPPSGG